MKEFNVEEKFVHTMSNKLFAIYGKILSVKGLAQEEQLCLEIEKLEKSYKEAQLVLQDFKSFIADKSDS